MWSCTVFGVEFRRTAGTASLAAQQFRAMLAKHVIRSWHYRILTVGQLLFPVVLAIIACVSMLALPSKADTPPLTLNLSYFDKPVVLFSSFGPGSLAASLAQFYSDVAGRYGKTIEVGVGDKHNMDDYLLDVAKRSIQDYNRRYIVAATASSNVTDSLIAHFNNFAIHSIAISVSLVDNALLRYAVPGSPVSRPIVTINHPLPRAASSRTIDAQVSSKAAIIFSLDVICGLSFIVGTFIVFAVKQRSTKSKQCQFVSGVSAIIYWLAAVIWSLVIFAVASFLIIVVVLAFQLESFSAWPLYR